MTLYCDQSINSFLELDMYMATVVKVIAGSFIPCEHDIVKPIICLLAVSIPARDIVAPSIPARHVVAPNIPARHVVAPNIPARHVVAPRIPTLHIVASSIPQFAQLRLHMHSLFFSLLLRGLGLLMFLYTL